MSNGKKILMIGNCETVIFRFRLELVQRLIADGYEVYTAFAKTEFGNGTDTAAKFGCRFTEVTMNSRGTNPIADLGLIKQYKKIIKDIMPDVVLGFTIKPNIYGAIAAAKYKVPFIMNITGLGTAVEQAGLLRLVTTSLYRYAMPKVSHVFFQNAENERFFASRRLADGKREILPGSGVNLEQFGLIDYPRGEKTEFLFMARILKEKGIDQYLDAAKSVRAKHPETVFHVLGMCDDEQYLKKLKEYEADGIIVYHGQQKDVLPFQKISSCTVHPTYYPEGMSNVLLESCACGRPIITTDRSGCREIVDDGVNGFVCRQQDSVDLTEKIERFLALPWEKRRDMGLAGRKKVEREFDRRIVVNKYTEQIEKTIGM
jgi:glycosyltransferase involved in cell wall biosynthesis